MTKAQDDGRAAELAIQAELLEVVGVLIQQRERLAGLLERANKLPSYKRVSRAWDRGDECAESVGSRLCGELQTAAEGPVLRVGPCLLDVITYLREVAALSPEECAASEAEAREQSRWSKAEVAEERRRDLAAEVERKREQRRIGEAVRTMTPEERLAELARILEDSAKPATRRVDVQ